VKLLLVEDDPETRAYVLRGLREDGHVVDVADTGGEALMLGHDPYDAIIMDRMLPEADGLAIIRALREAGMRTPVLFLTNLGGLEDRVAGLDAGGDDYLVKPFAFSELLARLRALTRRPPLGEAETVLRCADLSLDLVKRTVYRGCTPIDLQSKEFQLLEYLMRNAGRVVTRTMLLERVWGFHFEPRTSVVETYISRLRLKVDRPFDRPLLHTVRGAGYRLGETG
jgi:two-component system OmpR family response regulator